ncbi:CopD family protein [Nocardia thailandica]
MAGGGNRGAAPVAASAWRTLAPPAAAAAAGVVLAWAVSGAVGGTWAGLARALADGAGATVLGLAALPRLTDRHEVAWRPLTVAAGVWFAAELVVLAGDAADIVGVPVTDLAPSDFGTFLIHLSGGQIGLAILAATAAIACYSALSFRRPATASPDLVLIFAAVALALRPVTGHMSQQALGSVLAAVHALAAACWFGLLIAMALVLRTRGDWAAALPRYSGLAAPLIVLLAASGLINGLIRADGPAGLLRTGYGHILLAKLAVLLVLAGLGWWWRRHWVPRTRDHRGTAEDSLRNAVVELTVMGVAFGLAAALAVTA